VLDGGSVLFVGGSVDGRDFYDLLGDLHGYAMLYGVCGVGDIVIPSDLLEDLLLSFLAEKVTLLWRKMWSKRIVRIY
jgi:hypothetical protein